jgi:hypothetical protein
MVDVTRSPSGGAAVVRRDRIVLVDGRWSAWQAQSGDSLKPTTGGI